MKTLLRSGLLVMVLLLDGETAIAQPTTTFGGSDCGQWTYQQTEIRKAWLTGFLSGMNTGWLTGQQPGTKIGPLTKLNSAEQAFLWMDKYCRAHPLDSVGTGAISLFTVLYLELTKQK